MALTSPIDADQIVAEFETRVVDKMNNLIYWAKDHRPYYGTVELAAEGSFETNLTGRPIGISGSQLSDPVDASQIYAIFMAEAKQYTFIKLTHITLDVTVSDDDNLGNHGPPADPKDYNRDRGPIGDPGTVFDHTHVAAISKQFLVDNHYSTVLSDNYAMNDVSSGDVNKDSEITAASLEDLFDNLYAKLYERGSNVMEIALSSCHANCHDSCHSSRGRR